MDKKFKGYKVDYAAAYRHYIDFGGGRTLEKFCQDEGYDFEMKDEIAELTSRQDWTAREKELNERHARELYEQKMFSPIPMAAMHSAVQLM